MKRKPRIDSAIILQYLQSEVDQNIAEIRLIKGGMNSQTFSFQSHGDSFVIRVNSNDYGFRKDAYAAKHFASKKLSIPLVFKLGKMAGGYHTCISKMAAGKNLSCRILVEKSVAKLLTQVMEILDVIHATNILEKGFGYFDGKGEAVHNSWAQALLSIEHAHYLKWEKTIRETCMEAAVYKKLVAQLKALAPEMPNERKLIHGDMSMDNAFSDGERITSVIDWEGGQYGDPLFDIAWLYVWWKEFSFKDLYKNHAEKKGIVLEDYEKRLQCYATFSGLGALWYLAVSNKPQQYELLKSRLKEIGVL
ncbi:MAG: phosphotransferase [Dethiobacter sp.]|jgi:hygromycin-B 4-O-kinase|nr:phosphotransferase [Dethiobacter sp.]